MKKVRNVLSSKLEVRFEKDFLDPLKVKYERQYRLGIFVYDFFLPEYNTLIEIQGTYYHADPRVFKDEALNAMQRRNRARDINKSKSAKYLGFKLLEIFEGDILFNPQSVQEVLDEALP